MSIFQRLDPGMEAFRLGIQKCRKTIQCAVQSKNIYKVRGARIIFHLLRRAGDLRTARSQILSAAIQSGAKQIITKEPPKIPGQGKSLSGLTGIIKKKETEKANKGVNIKKKWGISMANKA